MSWIKQLIDFLTDLVCKCMIMCNCKSTCSKEQSTQSTQSPQSPQSPSETSL